MVTTVTSYADARYRASAGMGYDGVVRISGGGQYGTGALLFDGRAVLTAAHLVAGASASLSVAFQTVSGTQTYSVSHTLVNPNYLVWGSSNADVALVWLSQAPPVSANRYDIYRDSNEVGQDFTLVGYGQLGTGAPATPEPCVCRRTTPLMSTPPR
jgi:secreted trypsin-like serine protease